MEAGKATLAQIFRQGEASFLARFGGSLNRVARRALAKIIACRTAEMGARLYRCLDCCVSHIVYNSCRNRACPSCQGAAAEKWLDRQLDRVLPADYFHIVFTLPRPIASIAYVNRRVVFTILMKTAAQTLTDIAADPRRLGAHIGGTCVLHTWNQTLDFHPHVHALVANAGFDVSDGQWKTGSRTYFAPVRVLARYFRNRFLEQLKDARNNGRLVFHGSIAHLKHPKAFDSLLRLMRRTEWNVYAKPPFAGPASLLRYLSRYTHRVAIGNSRIKSFDGTTVSFSYRKPVSKGQDRPRYGEMRLAVEEFIRRYLMHVLPKGFHRIRHFGILANSNARKTLDKVQRQTGWNPDCIDTSELDAEADSKADSTDDRTLCPTCKKPMWLSIDYLSPQRIFDMLYLSRAPPLAA